ncbi:MAG: tyrosine-type recombinase/integrase [Vicinamibacteria bacterium]
MPAGRRFRQVPRRRDAIVERDRLLAEGRARRAWIYKRARTKSWTVEWEPGARRGAAGGLTLATFARPFLERAEVLVRPGTLRLYRWALDLHVLPTIGARTLRELEADPTHVRDLLFDLLASGLAKHTVANVRGVLSSLLEDAVEAGVIERNPAALRWKRLRLATTRAERARKVKAFDADQVRRLLEAADQVLPRWSTLFRLTFACGLRIGEALALQWDDLDVERRELAIRRGWTRGRVQPTKTGDEGVVDVPADVVDELHRREVAAAAEALAAGSRRSAWIFPSKTGSPHDYNDVGDAFKRALKAAGLPGHYSPHSLRHTFASLHLQRGAPLQYVQRMLRHRTVSLTADLYGSHLPARTPELADALFAQATGAAKVPPTRATKKSGA